MILASALEFVNTISGFKAAKGCVNSDSGRKILDELPTDLGRCMRDDKIVVMLTAPSMRRQRDRKLREEVTDGGPEKKDQATVTGMV